MKTRTLPSLPATHISQPLFPVLFLALALGSTSARGATQIVINPNASLAANTAALAAFERAAQSWSAYLLDPITITINAGLAALGSGVLGQASNVSLVGSYDTIRNQWAANSLAESGPAIVQFLPTAAQFSTQVTAGGVFPVGVSYDGNIVIAKANAKAMGFTGLDGSFGASDASITFSTDFQFDYDNSDGVDSGQIDFETVAAHEIGHALGFVSSVDDINGGATVASPMPLDLFRFQNDMAGRDPQSLADFTLFGRSLIPGQDANTDDISNEYRMSTGTGTTGGRDNRQASHWKDDALTGVFIGLLDPTLAAGVFYGPQPADLRALALIGYNVIPEPSRMALGLVAVAVCCFRRKR